MQSSMLKAIVEDFGNGGTIDGDLVVSGDLTVSGGGSLSFDEIIEGTQVIDVTNTEALLVRKNGDAGDVMVVDTTNEQVKVGDNFIVNASGTTPVLTIAGTRSDILFTESDTTNLNTLVRQQTGLFRIDTINDALDTVARRFTIDHSTGNVSIGSAEDASKFLQFTRGGSGSGVVRGSIGTNNSKLSFIGGSGTTPHMTLDSSGQLGIGTVSPASLLHIEGDTPVLNIRDNSAFSAGTGGAINFQGKDSNENVKAFAQVQGVSEGVNNGELILQTRNAGTLTTALTIDSSQRIGIGTSSPSDYHSLADNLVVASSGDTGISIVSGTSSDGRIFFADGTSGSDESRGHIRYDHSDDSMHFVTNDAGSALTIDSSQRVGIGTSTPSDLLEIRNGDNDNTAPRVQFGVENTFVPTQKFYKWAGASNLFYAWRIEVANSTAIGFDIKTGGSSATAIGSESLSSVLLLGADKSATFSGDILVNNSTPALTLQDSDGSNQTLEILHSGANTFFTSRNGSSNGAFFFRSYNGSSFSTALELDSSQNASFGANVIVGDITLSGSTISDSSALTISSGDDIIIDATSDINLDADGGDIRFKDNGTNFVTFSSSTGSTFSGQIKQFRDDSSTVGTNDVVIENDGSGDASLKFSLTGATDWFAYVDNSDSDKFKIRRSTSDYLVITETGNVGINDSSPEAHLTISPSTVGTTSFGGRSINYGVNINTASGRSGVTVKPANNYAIGDDNAGFQWLYPFDDGGDGDFKAFRVSEGATLVDKFYATRDGQGYFASNTGIGEINPSYKLDVVGSHSDPSKTAGATAVVGISAGASGSELVIGGEQTGGKIWIQNRHKTANGYDFEIALQPQGGTTSFGGTINANAGINFPDTQNASSDVNTLDDYEEGEHTTTITGTTSGSWVLDSAQNKLSYTKIGRLVTVIGKFETDSGSGAGTLKISMPFTAANLTSGAGIAAGSITINRYGSTSIATQITPIIFEGNNFINVQIHSTDGTSNESYVQADNIDAIFEGQLSITYFTD